MGWGVGWDGRSGVGVGHVRVGGMGSDMDAIGWVVEWGWERMERDRTGFFFQNVKVGCRKEGDFGKIWSRAFRRCNVRLNPFRTALPYVGTIHSKSK